MLPQHALVSNNSTAQSKTNDAEKHCDNTAYKTSDATAFGLFACGDQGNAANDDSDAREWYVYPIQRTETREESYDHSKDRQDTPNQTEHLHESTSFCLMFSVYLDLLHVATRTTCAFD
jgi:hypothetical protein